MGRVLGTGPGYGCKPDGYYMTLSGDGSCSLYVSKQKEKAEMGRLLATGKATGISPNKWNSLKLQFSRSAITGFVNNIKVFTVIDATFSHGMAGLVTGSTSKTNNLALFDNITIKSSSVSTVPPTAVSLKVYAIYK